MGWYFAWVLIHLGLLLIASDSIFNNYTGANYFWPFGSGYFGAEFENPKYYDITEFLVYTIFPFAILIIWSMIRSQKSNTENVNSNT